MQFAGNQHSCWVTTAAPNDLFQDPEYDPPNLSMTIRTMVTASFNTHDCARADPLHVDVCTRQRILVGL